MNIQDFRRILSEFTGQKRGVFVHKIFIEMTGDLAAAAMLSQILYWSDKTKDPDGWFYKSTAEWYDEICLSYSQLRRAYLIIKPLGIEHRLKRANGAPTAHYRVNWEVFVEKTAQHLDFQLSRNSEKSKMDFEESSKSITESTTESTNTEDSLSDKSDISAFNSIDYDVQNEVEPSIVTPPVKKPKPRHWTFEVIALECFSLQRDQINGKGGHIGVIVYGSKRGDGELGLLQLMYGKDVKVDDGMDILASQELTLMFAWYRRTKPGMSLPSSSGTIWKALVEYRNSGKKSPPNDGIPRDAQGQPLPPSLPPRLPPVTLKEPEYDF